MPVQEIPLSASPQTFRIRLGTQDYRFTLLYRGVEWVLDIFDTSENPLVCGIPLVTGIDLLAQYGYLGFEGGLIVLSDGDQDAIPTFDNLGTTSHLYFVTAA